MQSLPLSKPSIVLSPSANPPSRSARWEIDLSPGTWTDPSKRDIGWINKRVIIINIPFPKTYFCGVHVPQLITVLNFPRLCVLENGQNHLSFDYKLPASKVSPLD